MHTIAIINQKGGAGKSTLSIHLAVAAAQEGHNVALIDLDGQATSAEWGDRREKEMPVVISAHASRLARQMASVKESGGQLTFIDTVPRSDAVARDAAKAADLVIVPCQPNLVEVEATLTTIQWLRTTDTPFFIVLNKVAISGAEAQDAEEFFKNEHQAAVCPARLSERKAFWRSITDGKGVTEYEQDGKAAQEIRHLYAFISDQLNIRTSAHQDNEKKESTHA